MYHSFVNMKYIYIYIYLASSLHSPNMVIQMEGHLYIIQIIAER